MTCNKYLKRMGIDIDGVLADNEAGIRHYALKNFGVTIDKITAWNLPQCTDLTEQQTKQIFMDKQHYKNLKPYPGAAAAITELTRRGYDPWMVTARNVKFHELTSAWLRNRRIPYTYMIANGAKELMAERHHLCYFVEDNYASVIALSNICDFVWLVDHDYNQGRLPDNVRRIKHIEEILEDLK